MPFIREVIERTPFLRELKYRLLGPILRLRNRQLGPEEERVTRELIEGVLACSDNALIPRVHNAGEVHHGQQVMHNGIKVLAGSYYGHKIRRMLEATRGVHEPQEERVFAEVLTRMPRRATMIELGSYWAFYSMWFHHHVPEPTNYMVEPKLANLNYGRKNFEINGMKGDFTHAFVGSKSGMQDGVAVICVDDFVRDKGIEHVDILHADIQGFEVEMLQGASQTLARNAIDYIFISTHTADLHERCRQFLVDHDFEMICSANLDESFGPDGMMAARRRGIEGVGPIPIALRTRR